MVCHVIKQTLANLSFEKQDLEAQFLLSVANPLAGSQLATQTWHMS
jgi:hypothetical protein